MQPKPVNYHFILNGILQKMYSHAYQIDTQTNIIVALSSAIFIFSAQRVVSDGNQFHAYLLILALASSVAAIIGLLALNPPSYMRKKGQKESIIYHRDIASLEDWEEYHKRLQSMLDNGEEETVKQYAIEIYNLSKYSYLPKRKLFNKARDILVYGFLISFVLFALQLG